MDVRGLGDGRGTKEPRHHRVEGTRFDYRVVANDKQGNQKISLSRRVYIPRDDDSLGPEGVFSRRSDDRARRDRIRRVVFADVVRDVHLHLDAGPRDCLFELIGPGSGTWDLTVTPDGGSPTNITDASFPDQPRQTLYSNDDRARRATSSPSNSGTFGLDAVLG